MILACNIGNSKITIGCIAEDTEIFLERIATRAEMTDLEYAVQILRAFKMHGVDVNSVKGAVLSSVVAPMTSIFKKAMTRILPFEPIIVKSKNQDLLDIRLDHPEGLGSNLLCDAIAVKMHYRFPAIIVDMGCATSVGVLDENGAYIGGLILPGAQTSLNALTKKASALFHVTPEKHIAEIGKNTEDALNAGMVRGNAAIVDHLIERIKNEQHFSDPAVICTGHLSTIIRPYIRHEVIIDEYLALRGMVAILKSKEGEG